ncbi:hypothetical protein PSTG_16363 [Puccinia striiformis f. sp. tritici PST-78]|uniref:F-box protein Hrt3/FBXO9 C-terminal domain-containing protein n=1 Tax=Puccinia striiformis f. sp. tritici PST-78 TaxID=1165861 RepID=A0A0L0UTV3_9BASI|nr:hypothetical protein PSTG_16363 [Puccinia striiformis f. sp. tritici PST-78]
MSSSPPPPPSEAAAAAAASEKELESFRKKWIAEVNQATQASNGSTTTEESALTIYARAVYYERTGLLDNALRDYRKALRLEPNVDRAYHHLKGEEIQSFENLFSTEPSFTFQTEHLPTGSTLQEPLPKPYKSSTYPPASHDSHNTYKFLEYLLASFENNPWIRPSDLTEDDDQRSSVSDDRPDDEVVKNLSALEIDDHSEEEVPQTNELKFEPLNIDLKSYIQIVPLELFNANIFSPNTYDRSRIHLLISTIESFARVCRLARIITLNQSLWRGICLSIYTHDLFVNHLPLPPTSRLSIHDICRDRFDSDWRRLFILLPRVRLDGCYISLIRYPRQGESANPWYTPTHFVTYFRYLRFLEDGRCISFTSTDEPSIVVRNLIWPMTHPNNSSNLNPTKSLLEGCLFGLWRLDENRIQIYKLHQDHTTLSSSSTTSNQRIRSSVGRNNYQFQIDATLSSTKLGKMNKIEISRLSTLNLNTGELVDVPLPSTEPTYPNNSSSSSKPFIFSRVFSYDPS